MKKNVLLLIFNLALISTIFAQGTIRGKVSDENGETLIGVTIILKSDRSVATVTDLDGNYSLKINSSEPQILVVSYISFQTIEEKINLLNNKVIVKDFVLSSSTNDLGIVEIEAKQEKAKDYYMENFKKNSATTIDYVSSETMKKTGDGNAVAAVARVSGVATSGGLITVRGIGDRYVKTTINGMRIPTLDPLTNNIKLDIFPASLIDNIIITKTASPDLPGDWSGAYISIETKDYPEKLMVNVESQFGYNAQTTFKDVISSERSKTDWLGFDNSLRDNIDHDKIYNLSSKIEPTAYQEMCALGLSNYYNSMGVNNDNWSSDYFKLGMVQLGLLAPALYNDANAISEAQKEYDKTYKLQAFDKLYPEGTDFNHGFSSNWNTTKRKAPMNFSQSFSIGNQTKLFGKPLGFLFGFRYGNSIRYTSDGVVNRIRSEKDKTFFPEGWSYETLYNDEISKETNGWNALCNLAYKLNDKNSFSLMFMPNYAGTNDVRYLNEKILNGAGGDLSRSQNQFYEQRRQLIYQIKSEHFIPRPKMKIEMNASYTLGKSSAPDFKSLGYKFSPPGGYMFGPTVDGIYRFFRYLNENVFDSKISAELPIGKESNAGVRKLKFGGAFQKNDRQSNIYSYNVADGNDVANRPFLSSDDISGFLSPDKFIMTNRTVDFVYESSNSPRFNAFGYSTIKSGFAMIDYSIIPALRIAGGLRVEQSTIFSDVFQYNALGYAKDDIRRTNVGGFPTPNPADINELNFLPSANVIFKLKENKLAKINFRLNYSQTLARPSLRELNDVAIFDYEYRTLIYGNSGLKMAHIRNYDFRAESYFNNGDNISFSLFYKNFKDHIEMGFASSGVTWENIEKSWINGIEFEGKKSLTKYLEFRANVTLVHSVSAFIPKADIVINGVPMKVPTDTINRPMFGQAPYLVNGILSYKSDSLGLTAALSYNIQGPRLVIAGTSKEFFDVYEMPRQMLDLKISKTLGKYFSVSLTFKDILNAPVRRAYKVDKNWIDYDNYRYGTNYLLGISYKL